MSKATRQFAVVEIPAASGMENAVGRPVRLNEGVAQFTNHGDRAFGVIVIPAPEGEPMTVAACGSAQVHKIKVIFEAKKGDLLMVAEDGAAPFTAPDEWHQAWTCGVALEDGATGALVEAVLVSPTQIIDPAAP